MQTVHPTFVPELRAWFVDCPVSGNELRAPSLRELAPKLPAKVVIADYYPNGFVVARKVNDGTYTRTRPSFLLGKTSERRHLENVALAKVGGSKPMTRAPFPRQVSTAVMPQQVKALAPVAPAPVARAALSAARMGRPTKYDHNLALDLWAAGVATGDIAERMGSHVSTGYINDIVKLGRRAGDPRAIVRPYSIRRDSACTVSWNQERIDLMLLMVKQGAQAREIANELGGVTRSAVLGKLHRLGVPLDGSRETNNVSLAAASAAATEAGES